MYSKTQQIVVQNVFDGFICNWDNKNQNWKRYNENKFVALKRVKDSKSSTLNFINEVLLHTKLSIETIHIVMSYGITQDQSAENSMMVLEYAKNRTLGYYVFTNKLSLESKLYYLYNIADGLNTIHKNELIHRDL
ncbi:hypothetical protein C1646_765065 [Rhizophagus diaphanus]|nr:hypothetical protein C1646_765065 [Rhizophagus diaphanus] [Rhizophagus sp. MUCL 43196]